tara:strand:+ start:254 stop:1069 length:816 start_codon:yes stop_codon:yes gene_type:complete
MEVITEREVEWHKKNLKIFQIPKEGLEFAFLSADYRQVHQLVWCKDFLQDAVYAQINQKPIEIYGFSFNPATCPPVSMDRTRLMVTSFKDTNFGSKICNNCREFLHQIEDHLKMSKTVVEKCAKTPPTYRKSGVWILDSSKRWMKSPPMMSLFTLLIRIGLVHRLGDSFEKTLNRIKYGKVKPYNWRPKAYDGSKHDNDQNFLRAGKRGFDAVMTHGDRKIFHKNIQDNYPQNNREGRPFSTYILHDDCGIVGFSQGTTKKEFPHWHRSEL